MIAKRQPPGGATVSPETAAQIQTRLQEAVSLHQKGQLLPARTIYQEVLKRQPKHFDALHLSGIVASQMKDHALAVALIGQAIAVNPNNAGAHFNHGIALAELKRFRDALVSYDRALRLKPDYIEAYNNRGNVLRGLAQFEAAIASYDQALGLRPDFADAHNNRGMALSALRQFQAAISSFDKALQIKPNLAEVYVNRGVALASLGQSQAALDDYDQAIRLRPDYAAAYANRGTLLFNLRQYVSAVTCYDQAIRAAPDYADAYNNRGVALSNLNQPIEALADYNNAIGIDPNHADAYFNRGNVLSDLKEMQAAVESYGKALALRPEYAFLAGVRLHAKMHVCGWKDIESDIAALTAKISRAEKAVPPFQMLALVDSPSLQRQAAEIWVNDKCPRDSALGNIPAPVRRDKIRIGYFSMDFREHPVSFLTAGLFEAHNRDRFEIYAFSYGPDTQDGMRKRLEEGFDKFIDVRDQSDSDVAALARRMGIDIAVDLAGLTANARTGIFALRAAPVQVNYIGYPGTMAADYMDYIIADSCVIPDRHQVHYAEKVVYLPGSYQVNDASRKIPDRAIPRTDVGLPAFGFVFCCFNNSFKITPATFDVWMRLLKRVENSVLWLLEDNVAASENLRRESARRGIDSKRLIFAPRVPAADHLVRHRCADLFLDTLPYNAHTTASDALWAGLPVLTCAGESFASRVAASLLTSVGVPELITATYEDYEALGFALATDPARLGTIKHKLALNRPTMPLFDTKAFARHIEAAYTQMHTRYCAGLPPDHIRVGA